MLSCRYGSRAFRRLRRRPANEQLQPADDSPRISSRAGHPATRRCGACPAGHGSLVDGPVGVCAVASGPAPTSAVVAALAGSTPSLLHAFAFTLWTALALRGRPRTVWAVALAWAALESVIEAFQHPALHALLPAVARSRWAGTFDPWDLLAPSFSARIATASRPSTRAGPFGFRWLVGLRLQRAPDLDNPQRG